MDELAVHRDLEHTAAAGDQLDLRGFDLALNQGSQTGRARLVVSDGAVLDRDLHRPPLARDGRKPLTPVAGTQAEEPVFARSPVRLVERQPAPVEPHDVTEPVEIGLAPPAGVLPTQVDLGSYPAGRLAGVEHRPVQAVDPPQELVGPHDGVRLSGGRGSVNTVRPTLWP